MTENSEQSNAQLTSGESASTQTVSSNAPVEAEPAVEQTLPPEPSTTATGSPDEDRVTASESESGSASQDQAETAPAASGGRSRNGEKLTRVTLGSALIAIDTVSERLDRLDEAEIEASARRRTLDDVLVPMSQWQERFGVAVDRPTRHLMLGMLVDARSRAGATVRFINGISNRLAQVVNLLLKPVRTRRVFKPIRQGFDKAVERGDSQVERWRAMGRVEDARSRALAETALASAAEETMDELASNERVEVFIQDVIEAQTVGIADEIIEEIRERAVSSDNFFERPVRRLFRRPPRPEVPPPDFNPRLVRSFARRNLPIPSDSLLGQYAGLMSRLLAVVVDVTLIVIVLALGSTLLRSAIDLLGLQGWRESIFGGSGFTGLIVAGNGLVVVLGYLVLMWLLTGQTLGMMLLGLRVVNRTGGRLTIWQALLRIVGYIILPGIFFLGFLWILGDDKREAWHDKLARTYVVYAWDARPDETFLTYTMYMED